MFLAPKRLTASFMLGFLVAVPNLVGQTAEQKKHPKYAEIEQHSRAYREAKSRSDHPRAIAEATQALGIGRETFGEEGSYVARLYYDVASAYESKGDFDRSIDHYMKALAIEMKLLGPNHLTIAIRYNNLGYTYQGKGDYDRAVDYFEKALGIDLKQLGPEHKTIAIRYSNLGSAYAAKGEYDRAIAYATRALSISLKNLGPDHPNVATSYNNLAGYYARMGDYNRGIEYLEKAIVIIEAKLGPTDPKVATSYNNLGEMYRLKGEHNRAIELYLKALSISERGAHPESANLITIYSNLGTALTQKDEHERAFDFFKKAMTLGEKTLPAGHPSLGLVWINAGDAHGRRGEYDRAIDLERKGIILLEKSLGAEHPQVALSYSRLGALHQMRKDYGRAIQCHLKAIAISEKSPGVDHPSTASAYASLAFSYAAAEQYEKAVTFYTKAIPILENGQDRTEYLFARHGLGKVFEKLNRIEEAATEYKKVTGRILQYRLEMGREKSSFTAQYAGVFDRLRALQLRQGHIEAAFQADADKHGLSIAEDMSLKDALTRAGIPALERENLLDKVREISSLQSQHGAALTNRRKDLAGNLLDALQRKEREKESFDRDLIRRYPEYSTLREIKPLATRSIQSALAPDEVYISYVLSAVQPVAFMISRQKGLEVLKLSAKRRELELMIRNLHTLASLDENTRPVYKMVQTKNGILILDSGRDSSSYREEKDQVYAHTSKRGVQVQVTMEDEDDELKEELIGKIIGVMDNTTAAAMREELCRKLYDTMLAPVISRAAVKNIILVPDGAAYYLPFSILKDASGQMFGESNSWKLVHSGAVWLQLRNLRKSNARTPLLSIGNAVYSEMGYSSSRAATRGLSRSPGQPISNAVGKNRTLRTSVSELYGLRWENLPGTEEEILGISQHAYPASISRIENQRLGVEANRDEVLRMNQSRELSNYRILHFAVHGLFVDGNVQLNALVLTMPESSRKLAESDSTFRAKYEAYARLRGELNSDGYLRLGDVKSLRLDSDLVVMSACETSLGHEIRGEGMVGLPQAFLIAGSRNVIASLWSVDDKATSELMQELYANLLKRGMKPQEALREAQKTLRSKPEYSNPYYWAAFVVYGD